MKGKISSSPSKMLLTKRAQYCSIWFVPNAVGVFNGEGPPVPIPNTEVKLIGADDTWLATAWKNREMPTQRKPSIWMVFCFIPQKTLSAGWGAPHKETGAR